MEDSIFNLCAQGNITATNTKRSNTMDNAGIEIRAPVSVVEAMGFSSDNGHTLCFDWNGTRLRS